MAISNAVGFPLGGSFHAFIFIGTYTCGMCWATRPAYRLAWLATSVTSVALGELSQKLVTLVSPGLGDRSGWP